MGLSGHSRAGARLFHVLGQQPVAYIQMTSRYAYEGSNNSTVFRVLDVRTGLFVRSVTTPSADHIPRRALTPASKRRRRSARLSRCRAIRQADVRRPVELLLLEQPSAPAAPTMGECESSRPPRG
jgi:hypothetical protein